MSSDKRGASFRMKILLQKAERRDGMKLDSLWHHLRV